MEIANLDDVSDATVHADGGDGAAAASTPPAAAATSEVVDAAADEGDGGIVSAVTGPAESKADGVESEPGAAVVVDDAIVVDGANSTATLTPDASMDVPADTSAVVTLDAPGTPAAEAKPAPATPAFARVELTAKADAKSGGTPVTDTESQQAAAKGTPPTEPVTPATPYHRRDARRLFDLIDTHHNGLL